MDAYDYLQRRVRLAEAAQTSRSELAASSAPSSVRPMTPSGTLRMGLTDAYQTIDLTKLGYAQVEVQLPYAELGVR